MTAPAPDETLPVPATPISAGGQCPVCASVLAAGRLVSCARCDAVHHRDCIEYGGGCAIYACGSRAYRAARGGLVHVLRPASVPCPVDKIGFQPGGEVVTLERPVLRIEMRHAPLSRRRSWRAGALLTFLGVVLVGGLSIQLLLKLAWAVRELANTHVLMLLFMLPCAVIVLWTLAATLIPGSVYTLAYLFHRLDGGEFVIERGRLMGRRRAVGDVLGIALTTPGPGEVVRLEAHLTAGRTVVLADDQQEFMDGYHWTDLSRIGMRIAAEAEVPFERSLPWKPEPVGQLEERTKKLTH